MNIIYRQIKKDDKNSVNDLYEKLLKDHGSNYGLGFGYGNWVYDEIFSEEKSYNAYVASLLNDSGNKSEIIGYIMLHLDKEKNNSFIQGLFVEEEYRGKGIGKELITEAGNYSKDVGCKYIEAIVSSYYLFIKFYRKLGFSIDKKITNSKYIISKNLERSKELEKEDDELEL